MINSKRILVCPLDWGLGHASRMIPVISLLQNKGFEVIIGADKGPLQLLHEEFPELDWIRIPGVEINYSKRDSQVLKMLTSLPKIKSGIRKEHQLIERIVVENKIDIIISDNRYGLWTRSALSIIVTHQLMLKMSTATQSLEKSVHKFLLENIENFDRCWIPDFEGEGNLSGDLAHKYPAPENAVFIGPLSRFNNEILYKEPSNTYDILVVLSGPEPQRTIFENILIDQLKESNYKTLLVRGKPGDNFDLNEDNIEVVSHLTGGDLAPLIGNTKYVICRAGYSTIMDLVALQKPAILVPTPGQTEQEYLAERFMSKGLFYTVSQSDFNLDKAIESCGTIRSDILDPQGINILSAEVDEFFK